MVTVVALAFLSLAMKPHVRQAELPPAARQASVARAKYLITTTDDFIVEVYLNGESVPQSKRTLLEERYGATVERIDVEVHKGDWLVFNVVNNRMRWGGAYYFAVAGCFARDEFGFVSRSDAGNWSVCDTPHDVDNFISKKTFFRHRPAQAVTQPWADGDALMQQHAGPGWKGTPVWGSSRNTWVKVVVD